MSDPAPIRAAIIDDHEAIRLGVGVACSSTPRAR